MFFFSKKKYEINQANLSIVHYCCECHYESLNIFVIQNLYYSKFALFSYNILKFLIKIII